MTGSPYPPTMPKQITARVIIVFRNIGAIMTASIQTDETSSEHTFLIDELIRERGAKRGFTNHPVPIGTVKIGPEKFAKFVDI